MTDRKYPDDSIRDVANKILYQAIPNHHHEVWNRIKENVIAGVKKNTDVCYGNGFTSLDVKNEIGEALCRLLNSKR